MRLAIWPLTPQPWSEVAATVHHAERTGWDGAYVADHFMGDGGEFGAEETPWLEATATISALLALTERLRVGSLVLGSTYRHPAVLANWAATADQVSGGRLVLGVGAGWQQNEHEQYGLELPGAAPLVRRFDEYCQVLTGLLREDRTTVDGEFFQLDAALCEPKPVQARLPLLIGGKRDRMLRLVARHADQWNMWGLPPVIAERSAVLDQACAVIDRDPADIVRSAQALVLLTDDAALGTSFVDAVAPRAAFAGTADRFAELVQRWADVGVGEVVVPDSALGSRAHRLEAMDALLAAVRSTEA
jgi:alkanesulfonate monooxygenase SsuD/methylene tetrahydromethanopterin reductase-like flavin-dependent oxidoreductase (luciferase family)